MIRKMLASLVALMVFCLVFQPSNVVSHAGRHANLVLLGGGSRDKILYEKWVGWVSDSLSDADKAYSKAGSSIDKYSPEIKDMIDRHKMYVGMMSQEDKDSFDIALSLAQKFEEGAVEVLDEAKDWIDEAKVLVIQAAAEASKGNFAAALATQKLAMISAVRGGTSANFIPPTYVESGKFQIWKMKDILSKYDMSDPGDPVTGPSMQDLADLLSSECSSYYTSVTYGAGWTTSVVSDAETALTDLSQRYSMVECQMSGGDKDDYQALMVVAGILFTHLSDNITDLGTNDSNVSMVLSDASTAYGESDYEAAFNYGMSGYLYIGDMAVNIAGAADTAAELEEVCSMINTLLLYYETE